MKRIIILIFFFIVQTADAQWTNFPLSENNTNAYNWDNCKTNWLQLIAATREKSTWFLGETNFLLTATYTVPAGYTNAVIVYNGHTFTNRILCYTNIAMTNLTLTPYTYTDAEGSHTATGYPYITQAEFASLDSQIDGLIPLFTMTNLAATDWFGTKGTNDLYPSDFPMCSRAALFDSLGIGYVTNKVTDAWNFITNGDAYYTRYPVSTSKWFLTELAYLSNGCWATNIIGSNALRYYETVKPVAIFYAGIVAGSPRTFTLYGEALVTSNQTVTNKTELVTVSPSSTTALTELWYRITNITASANGETGCVFAVLYTNPHPVYGDAPYEIYAKDLDERWKVLNSLRWTRAAANWTRGKNGMINEGYSWEGPTDPPSTFADAVAMAEAGAGGSGNVFTNIAAVLGYGNVVKGMSWKVVGGGGSWTSRWFNAHKSWNTNQVVRCTDGFSNFVGKGYVYSRATAYTNGSTNTVFDFQGDDAYFETNKLVSQGTNWLVNGNTNDVEIGHGQYFVWSSSANWMDEADIKTNSDDLAYPYYDDYYHDQYYKGYDIDLNLFLYKWDEYESGIVWK